MQAIIRGRKYDTTTAAFIAKRQWGTDGEGQRWLLEALYRKTTGEYFLAGTGGADTRYACHPAPGEWAPGAKIIPVDPATAAAWCESNIPVEAYEALFGEVPE